MIETAFSNNDDEIIIELFNLCAENGWSNMEMERKFLQRTNRRLTFKTLKARFDGIIIFFNLYSRDNDNFLFLVINTVQIEPVDQINQQRPGTSASFATPVFINDDQPMSIQHEYSLDQQMVSLEHQEAIADITSELELSKFFQN